MYSVTFCLFPNITNDDLSGTKHMSLLLNNFSCEGNPVIFVQHSHRLQSVRKLLFEGFI
jgi:hypothetical protein